MAALFYLSVLSFGVVDLIVSIPELIYLLLTNINEIQWRENLDSEEDAQEVPQLQNPYY